MNILVLGGYGGTGKVFCRCLLKETPVHVIVAGRNLKRAEDWVEALGLEFSTDRISARYVDAAERSSLREAFRGIEMVLVAATTTSLAKQIAEIALEAHIDYLDIYYRQDVYPVLHAMADQIRQSGQCFITQAGFHPGLPAALVRWGDSYFDTYDSAVIAFAMNTRIEKAESVYELVDALADYRVDVCREGQWRRGTYKDAVRIDFGSHFGVMSCVPLEMVEIREFPKTHQLKEVGVYAAGFNWLVDYLVFPLIVVSQTVRKGLLRKFWAKVLVWGINNFSRPEQGLVFLLDAKGSKDGKAREVTLRCEHRSAYDFTVIPVIAALKQYLDGSIRKPGLWMMGHWVEPDRLVSDMRQMGVDIQTSVA